MYTDSSNAKDIAKQSFCMCVDDQLHMKAPCAQYNNVGNAVIGQDDLPTVRFCCYNGLTTLISNR